MNIDLSDHSGSIIQATLFKDAIEKYESVLHEGSQYLFGNGMIKVSNKKFTHIEHEFNVTFDKMAIIKGFTNPSCDSAPLEIQKTTSSPLKP